MSATVTVVASHEDLNLRIWERVPSHGGFASPTFRSHANLNSSWHLWTQNWFLIGDVFMCVIWWRPQVKCHYLFFSKFAQPHLCSVLGVRWKQRKTYWFLSGPMGHWNFLMPAQTCNLLPIFCTESKPTTPKAQFWVGGLLLELCRQSLTICPLPLPRPLVSSLWHSCFRLYYVAIILAVICDLRSVRSPNLSLILCSLTGAYSAHLKWSEPEQPNGVISHYRLVYRKRQQDPTLNSTAVTALTVEVNS